MPAAAEIGLFVGFLDDLEQFRVAVHAFHIRVDVQRPETAGEGLVLVRRHAVLAAQDDDLVVEKGLVDGVELGVRQVLCQVHAVDFRAECAGEGLDGHAHGPSEPFARGRCNNVICVAPGNMRMTRRATCPQRHAAYL